MKLTKKDKILLLVLILVAVIALPYFFVIQPLLDKYAETVKEIAQLTNEVKYVEQLAMTESEYQQAAETTAENTAALYDRFPCDIPQEKSLLFMHNLEQMIPLSLYQVSFGDDAMAPLSMYAEGEEETTVAESDEELLDADTENTVVDETTESTPLPGGLTAISTSTRFAYDAGYEEFKRFLKYILDYSDRMVITELDASYSAELNLVNGNFTMTQYAIKGGARNDAPLLEPNMIQGTTNVFKQASGSFDTVEPVQETPDFFMMLNQPNADVDPLVIGQSADTTEETYFASSKNDKQSVTITFQGENGQYNANYSIGKERFSKNGVDFSKDGAILLQILSSERLNNKDKVSVDLSLVNETDVPLNVEILNDSGDSKRVEIKGRTGNIQIK